MFLGGNCPGVNFRGLLLVGVVFRGDFPGDDCSGGYCLDTI